MKTVKIIKYYNGYRCEFHGSNLIPIEDHFTRDAAKLLNDTAQLCSTMPPQARPADCPPPRATEQPQERGYGFEAQMAHYPDPPPEGCQCEACHEGPSAPVNVVDHHPV